MAKKLGQVASGLKNPRPNLYVLTPLVVPLPSSTFAKTINQKLMIAQVRRALKRIAATETEFWTFTPDVGYLIGAFDESKVVYYCVDDHSQFTGYNVNQVLEEEEALCRRADLVVTTSKKLQDAKKAFNPNTRLLQHGVDHSHFANALSEQIKEPPELEDIPHPRIGFFGLIRDWVDLELVDSIAKVRPEWHFVMVGDATFDISNYQRRPNFHFLGRKPYDELPGYCRGFDVGLIPFKLNALTLSVNPIKLREYLAAGLPVVSTPLPEVAQYERWVSVSGDATAFEEAIDNALAGCGDRQLAGERSEAMSQETWDHKVETLRNWLTEISNASGSESKP